MDDGEALRDAVVMRHRLHHTGNAMVLAKSLDVLVVHRVELSWRANAERSATHRRDRLLLEQLTASTRTTILSFLWIPGGLEVVEEVAPEVMAAMEESR